MENRSHRMTLTVAELESRINLLKRVLAIVPIIAHPSEEEDALYAVMSPLKSALQIQEERLRYRTRRSA